jgi:membrane protein
LRPCSWASNQIVTLGDFTSALVKTYSDVNKHHTLQIAAALSYHFVLSLFPALIFLSAIVAYLPLPDLFGQAVNLMGRFVPPDSMGVIKRVLADVITPNRGAFLSFGFLGTLWAASGGFAAAMEALNIAYDVEETRPFWKTRPLAIGLTLLIGAPLLLALAIMIVGPQFGQWLAGKSHVSWLFAVVWPYLYWTLTVAFTVLAVEALYFLAPNVRQRFLATLPGALLAVGCWIGLSYLLGIYFRRFANLNKTYGTLGAAIAVMVWLHWTGFAMLVGAELNAETAKVTARGRIPQKPEPPPITKLDLAASGRQPGGKPWPLVHSELKVAELKVREE